MPEKILVVDDDLDTVKFIEIMLSKQGYQVVSATSGLLALEVAHREHPDLIILDVMMPGMDGYEVARSLRRHPETAVTPILMFTAKSKVEDKVTGYETGVNIYLTKPIHPVDLQANIKSLLAQHLAHVEQAGEKGHVVGVVAAKGGMGVSTVALNLAITYHQKHNAKVIAAELRPCQGSWAIDLNLGDANGLSTLLQKNVTDITQAAVNDQLVPTFQGIRVLLASNDSKDAELINASAQLEAIVQQLSVMAPLVVLDIGTNSHPAFNMLTDLCSELLLVTEPQPIAVKRTHILAKELSARGFGRSKAFNVVTVNRTRSDMMLSVSQVESMVGQPVALGFPPANELAYRAAEQSVALTALQPEGVIAQQFALLADQVKQRLSNT
jgi:CheY-like chemotaxis protein/MinD-like ATPase involved in chromosome partitioning or flagellar assembly